MNEITKINQDLAKSDSGGLLTNFPFHDAKIVDVLCGESRGKKYIRLIVDTKTSYARSDGRFFKITFKNGEFLQEPERKKDCYVVALDCSSSDKSMRARFELEYFVGEEKHSDVMEIEFTEVKMERK